MKNRAKLNHLFRGGLLGLLLWISAIGCAQAEINEQTGPWLEIFSSYVVGLYVDADHYASDQPIPLEAVLVHLGNDQENYWRAPKSRLASYVTHRMGPAGCLFEADQESLRSWLKQKTNSCDQLRRRAASKLMPKFKACEQRISGLEGAKAYLFVDKEIARTQCVVSPPRMLLKPIDQSGMWSRSELSWGSEAYLHLETNRLFGCPRYGRAVEYRAKVLPQAKAMSEWLFHEPFVWSKQYLIKTRGFKYCWGARRVIDEPEGNDYSVLFLNDGTAVVPGNVSVLRVRLKDGSTDAPAVLVKVYDPVTVRRELLQHGAKECVGDALAAGICPLAVAVGGRGAGWRPPEEEGELPKKNVSWNPKKYNSYVILGIDAVLQALF